MEKSGNYKLIIEYDGTRYHGWQKQPRDNSIQVEIETALQTMTGQKVALTGSGRTDAGVHAIGQVANFYCNTDISPQAVQNGLNALLPDDITVHQCDRVSKDFHARYNAKSKTYRYRILNRAVPSAIGRRYEWWIRSPLDLAAMKSAISPLMGQHDFKAFEGAGSPRSHTVRNVIRAEFNVDSSHHIDFIIEADGFLRYMVRNIMGTLVDIGRGKRRPGEMDTIIRSRNRSLAGATAPPQGLCLIAVKY